jgi:class 3 adenylate cyclase/tetratricopeptide (TPR) repeat protein
MLCRYCNSENNAANTYCDACGKPFGLACGACGHVNHADSRFCGKCSEPLEAPTPVRRSMDALRALSVTGGERKRLTVVFADIANSTSLIERQDPEDALRRMQPAIDAMKRAVDRHGGVAIRVQGDGVMALFGAPRPYEDHALRACAAALAMQSAVTALGDADLKIRVGLNTGLVVVQAVENSLGVLTYDIAGPAAHLAARMEQAAEPGHILLTSDTVTATRQSVEVFSLGKRAVRGLSEPVEVFQLQGVKHAPASAIFRSQPQLSRLTGRAAELAALDAELGHVRNGEARVVGVVAEAGAGKSRLCFEFVERCRDQGIAVHETRVLAHAQATTYQPVLELLRDYLGLKAGQAPDDARRQITAAIAALPVADDTLPLLLDFLGLGDAGRPGPKPDPAVRKSRLTELVRSLVRSGAADGPSVIVVEDLHWIDSASGEFIEAMADAAVGTRTLLLFNFRSGYSAPWMQREHYRQIVLSPLDRVQTAYLLGDLLGLDSSMDQVAHDIADRAQGNPFFAEELVRTLVERGHLEGKRGAYRLTQAVDAIPLPTTIEALLAARIDRLDEAPRRILHCAAVIGREVPASILENVANQTQAELEEPLRQLRQADLLHELSMGPPGLFAFSHPLIQEVCYQSLLRDWRRKIHADVARALKVRSNDPWEERAGLLAYHLEEAGELMEAAQAAMRSAMWVGGHDSREALRGWKKVHRLLTALPASESADWLRVNTCLQIMGFGWREGLPIEEARVYFEEAKQIALATKNFRANAWAYAAFGRNLAVAGSADDYISLVREALAFAGEAKDGSAEVMLTASLSQSLRLAGRLREALQANIEATERVDEISAFDRQLMGFDVARWLTAMRGQILVLLGRYDEARPFLDRMVQGEVDPHDITQHLASTVYVDLAWAENNSIVAERHAERATALAIKSGSPYVHVAARAGRGVAHMVSGRFAAAAADLKDALEFARRRRAGLETEARLLAELANAHRLNGDQEAAARTAAEAIEVSQRRGARVPECLARIVLAETALTAGDASSAAREMLKVRVLMEETGAKLYASMVESLAGRIGGQRSLASRERCS